MDARREVGREVTWVTVFINCNNAFVPQLAGMLQRTEGVQFQSDCEIGDLDDHQVRSGSDIAALLRISSFGDDFLLGLDYQR